MIVIGMDPGLAHFGFAAVRCTPDGVRVAREVLFMGVVETKKAKKLETSMAADNVRRAIEVAHVLDRLMAGRRPTEVVIRKGRGVGALFDPAPLEVRAVCVESMSHPRSSSAAAKMAMTWGMIVMGAVRRGTPIIQQSPQAVKLALVGTNDASKQHVERVLVRRYGAKIRTLLKGLPRGQHEHAYDALAAATACAESAEGRAALATRGTA
jgi:Holliday junction resolvasome RuvABC endonuclease subunit